MSFVIWVILIGTLVLFALAALIGGRTEGEDRRRMKALLRDPATRQVVVAEVGVVVGAVLLAIGLLLELPVSTALGLLILAAAILRAVIPSGSAAEPPPH